MACSSELCARNFKKCLTLWATWFSMLVSFCYKISRYWFGVKITVNLIHLNIDYLDFLILQTISLIPVFLSWILINQHHDLRIQFYHSGVKKLLWTRLCFPFKEQKWHWHVINIHLTAENWVSDYPIDYVQTNVSQC